MSDRTLIVKLNDMRELAGVNNNGSTQFQAKNFMFWQIFRFFFIQPDHLSPIHLYTCHTLLGTCTVKLPPFRFDGGWSFTVTLTCTLGFENFKPFGSVYIWSWPTGNRLLLNHCKREPSISFVVSMSTVTAVRLCWIFMATQGSSFTSSWVVSWFWKLTRSRIKTSRQRAQSVSESSNWITSFFSRDFPSCLKGICIWCEPHHAAYTVLPSQSKIPHAYVMAPSSGSLVTIFDCYAA